jgi:hypothetical protein
MYNFHSRQKNSNFKFYTATLDRFKIKENNVFYIRNLSTNQEVNCILPSRSVSIPSACYHGYELWSKSGAAALSMTTLSITTFCLMTFCLTTLSLKTFCLSTFCLMTVCLMTFCLMTF